MKQLAWTKFQDFYLRLGFLKLLVVVLSPDRRSTLNDGILRRLERPLFDSAAPDRVETLLIEGDCPSLLFAVTGPTAYKILDWARDVELMGRGNQITERGLLLRHLVDVERATAFLAGEVAAWNPFRISLNERLFLLYHLAEIDGVIFELVNDLGSLPAGTVLETNEAARMTCKALLRVLSRAKNEVQPRDVLRFRIACDLANTIAAELGMADEAQSLIGSQVRKRPKPVKRVKRKGSVGATPRKTTKNADHQTVPRFEQLVDLGFLTKPGADAPSEEERLASRKRWKYVPTEICHRWHRAMRGKVLDRSSFLWNGFSAACFEAFEIAAKDDATGNERTIAEYVWRSYRSIERRAGMNPVESIALFAMLLAAIDGVRIELSDVHRLMIRIKRDDLMPDHVFFASGNELDHMFVHIKPGFVERFDGAQP